MIKAIFFQKHITLTIKPLSSGETMLKAYILVNADPGLIWNVAEDALKVEGVKMAHAVTGEFDDVIFVEFTRMEDLGEIIKEVQSINGVRRTQTLVVIPRPIRE